MPDHGFELGDGELSRRRRGAGPPGGEAQGWAEQRREIAAGDADGAHGEGHEPAVAGTAGVEALVEGEDPLEICHVLGGRDHLDHPRRALEKLGRDAFEIVRCALGIVPRSHDLFGRQSEGVDEPAVAGMLEIDERGARVASGAEDLGASRRIVGSATAFSRRSQGREHRQRACRDRGADVDPGEEIEAKFDDRGSLGRRGESGEGIVGDFRCE